MTHLIIERNYRPDPERQVTALLKLLARAQRSVPVGPCRGEPTKLEEAEQRIHASMDAPVSANNCNAA